MAIRKNREAIRHMAASQIKAKREATSTSQLSLAKKVGVSQPLVSAWERGKVAPSIEDLVNIELALQVPKGELILSVAYGGAQE